MMSSNRLVVARTSRVTAATLGSRLLGFARDIGTAAVLGAGPLADALMAALSLPLLARRLLAEGAFNAALLPALARAPDAGAAARLVNGAFVLLTSVLLLLAIVGALAMPLVILVLAPGFALDGPRADLAIACGRIAIFYLPLAAAAAVLGGLANSVGRVLLPAFAPLVANAVVLVAIAYLVAEGHVATPFAALVMAGVSVLSGVAQVGLMVAACRRVTAFMPASGFLFSPAWRVLRAAGPALLFAGMPQMRLLIVSAMVSAVPGAVSSLNYAQRLVDLPLGLVGASAGAVLVPLLTTQRQGRGAGESSGAALAALAFALPAAAGLFLLAEPIVGVLYQRGGFTVEDTRRTAALLSALALALPFQGLEKILSAVAMSHGLTRQAERAGLVSLLAALILAAGLGFGLGPIAGACAVALSALYASARLSIELKRRNLLRVDRETARSIIGLCLACAVMAVGIALVQALWSPEGSAAHSFVRLGVFIASGIAIYGVCFLVVRRRWARREP